MNLERDEKGMGISKDNQENFDPLKSIDISKIEKDGH